MKRLPIYDEVPQAPVGWTEPVVHDAACSRCDLHDGVKTVCMRPERARLGPSERVLLVLGEAPLRDEDSAGRPMSGGVTGSYLRSLLKGLWSGVVLLDYAVRCAPGNREIKDKHVEACRPYTAELLRKARPEKILLLGSTAFHGFLDRAPSPESVRGGYGWWFDEDHPEFPDPSSAVPVWLLPSPLGATRNWFLRRAFEQQLSSILGVPEARPAPPASTLSLHAIETAADSELACGLLRASGVRLTYDVETSGIMFTPGFALASLAIATPHGLVYQWDAAQLSDPEIRAPLIALLRDPEVEKGGHNSKYDNLAVLCDARFGFVPESATADTLLWLKLLEADVEGKLALAAERVGFGGHKGEAEAQIKGICRDLNALAAEPFRAPLASGKQRKPYTPKWVDRARVLPAHLEAINAGHEPEKFAYGYLPVPVRRRYNALDAVSTAALDVHLSKRMAASPEAQVVWSEITGPAVRALTRMEAWGVHADIDAIDLFERHLTGTLLDVEAGLRAWGDFNPGSSKQLQELLFQRLKLPPVKVTPGGAFSTDDDVLERLKARHPVVPLIQKYRHLTKMRSTYATGMRLHVRPDGRIHPSYLLHGTETGRPSGREPNLLNIPRAKGSPEGRMARNVFAAARGFKLLEGDMSQQELRVAARRSGDKLMRELFISGADFHRATLEMIYNIAFGLSDAQWKDLVAAAARGDKGALDRLDDYRSKTKSTNFGIWYGKEAAGLAAEFGCSVDQANRIVNAVLGNFPQAKAYIEKQLRYGRENGGTWTMWKNGRARWRPLWAIGESGADDATRHRRATAERGTWNTSIQGEAADYVTATLWPLVQWVEDNFVPARVVLTVYDSILVEVRDDCVEEVALAMRRLMTGWDHGDVPLVVDFKVGQAWGSMTDYHPGK